MTIQTNEFNQWLNEQQKLRNWSDYELSKKAGISHSVISRARQGALPKWEACESIAKALDVSPIIVFRKAGLLPPGPPDDATFDDWKVLLKNLSDRDRNVLKQTARTMLTNAPSKP